MLYSYTFRWQNCFMDIGMNYFLPVLVLYLTYYQKMVLSKLEEKQQGELQCTNALNICFNQFHSY